MWAGARTRFPSTYGAAKRRQTDYKSLGRQGKFGSVHESAFEIELKNAKQEPVTVGVLEPMPGDWEVLQSSQPYTKEAAGAARFKVTVPAGDSAILTYRVRVRW